MRSIPEQFYHSRAWKSCRASYLQLHPFCEACLRRGLYVPAAHVHHRIRLNEDNYRDAEIALNFEHLEALCIECHNKAHRSEAQQRRYRVDELGRISPYEPDRA